jgi:glyoxylase-like metal-dependent hydrolase (beta-lactamase superfamily II)
MMLGTFEVTALLDGTHPFPAQQVLTRPAQAPGANAQVALAEASPGEAEALLAAAHLSAPVEGSINAFLINTGSRLVLIDSGAGALYGAEGGHLLANLRAAGYRPEQIDDVLLTHLHADHVGGIVVQGRIAFPNATVHVSRDDATYWLTPANRNTAPALLHPMFDAAAGSLKPYIAARRLETFDAGADIVPGIRAEADAGHTPGHTIYRVQSQGQTLLVWGDTVHVAPVQFPDPGVTVRYDSDAAQAVQQRLRLYADAARHGYWIAAAHIAFPGLGHIGSSAQGFRWIPANYTTQLTSPAPGTQGPSASSKTEAAAN